MACIPYMTWLDANAACKAKTSTFDVRGFGYAATGMSGLRGLGIDVGISVTPASIANAIQSGQVVQTASPSAPAVTSGATSINTTPVYTDPNDPCYISSQTPCPAGTTCPAVCPPGWHSMGMLAAPGKPALCNCAKDKPTAASPSSGSAVAPPMTPGGSSVTQASAAGGFSHWGLLAALAVGGGAIYLVTRKKAA